MTIHQRYPSSITLSLAEFLKMAGVPIIPSEMINSHKRSSVQTNRAGAPTWPLSVAYIWLYDMCDRFYARTALTIGAVFTAILISLELSGSAEPSAIWWLADAIFAIFFPLFFVGLTGRERNKFGRFLQAGFYWYSFDCSLCWLYREIIPERIEHRISEVTMLTEPTRTKIFVERFGPDPLIYVIDLDHPKERVYFGAWNTGTELDRI